MDGVAPPTEAAAFSFGGESAKTADNSALRAAKKKMGDLPGSLNEESQNAERERIWRETGWILGRDNKWRFEIDGSQMKINIPAEWRSEAEDGEMAMHEDFPKTVKTLDEIMEHPQLFAAYPQLAKTPVIVYPTSLYPDTEGADAVFFNSPEHPLIQAAIEEGYPQANDGIIIINEGMKESRIPLNLIHEIQHRIQAVESFAKGDSVHDAQVRIDADAEFFKASAEAGGNRETEAGEGSPPSADERDSLKIPGRGGNAPVLGDIPKTQRQRSFSRDRIERYRRVYGEAESREAANRLNRSAEWRRNNPPTNLDGIPDSELEILSPNAAAFSFSENEGAEKNERMLDLESEARKHSTFDSFERAFLGDIHHGTYWHLTENPNFAISQETGPRDLSSLADGKISEKGALMVTSHLEHWNSEFEGDRLYAARIDLSALSPNEYRQVNRGFGNEIYLTAESAAKAQVKEVLPIADAVRMNEERRKHMPQNSEELKEIWGAGKERRESRVIAAVAGCG